MLNTMLNARIIATIAGGAIAVTRENPENARPINGIDIISHYRMTLPESGETLRRSCVRITVGVTPFHLLIDSTVEGDFVGFTPEVSRGAPLGTQTTAVYAIDSAWRELTRIGK